VPPVRDEWLVSQPPSSQARRPFSQPRQPYPSPHRWIEAETYLGAQRRRYGLAGRWWRRRRAAELADQLADCRARRERSEQRLAHLDAKLQVIDNTEQARGAWITQARELLVRGVAATHVMAEREQQHRDGEQAADQLAWPAAADDSVGLGAVP
jgi:hypothetical protein